MDEVQKQGLIRIPSIVRGIPEVSEEHEESEVHAADFNEMFGFSTLNYESSEVPSDDEQTLRDIPIL